MILSNFSTFKLHLLLKSFIQHHQLSSDFNNKAKRYYLPLAERLTKLQQAVDKTFFVGINGCQGSGKSTLADFLEKFLSQTYHLNIAVLSLDDFYLNREQRQKVARQYHSLFKVRGVPGTHDMLQMKSCFQSLTEHQGSTQLPRFNKVQDNPAPKDRWPSISTPVDMVIMEGWCWGVPPQQPRDLIAPVNNLEAQQDEQGLWRKAVNNFIKKEYQPLYNFMDYWIMLKAPRFKTVLDWRIEQEHKLINRVKNNGNLEEHHMMSDEDIEHFIKHYQRLTEFQLNVLPDQCDEVFELDEQRNITHQLSHRNGISNHDKS